MQIFKKKQSEEPPKKAPNFDAETLQIGHYQYRQVYQLTNGDKNVLTVILADALLDGTIDDTIWENATNLAINWNVAAERQKAERSRIAEEQRKLETRAELVYPRWYAMRNGNPEPLQKFLAERPLKELIDLLEQYKAKPFPSSQSFPPSTFYDAVKMLEETIEKRKTGKAIGFLVNSAKEVLEAENTKYID